ncbi:serine/threonine protein kinase [PVC group bacterium]|nr:serine/threonine protein kinase [PVC group bacterium]
MIGTEVRGFQIIKKIGSGGMGEVYLARQESLGRDVAIKTIPADLAADPDLVEQFYTEARTIAGLNHPNIVTVYDVFEEGHIHFIVMEYVEGQTLRNFINKKGSTGYDLGLYILSSMAEALVKAHAKGIIHRDIKPDNIFVMEDHTVRLMDFGLASAFVAESQKLEGNVRGTPVYMAQEQFENKGMDDRTDLYSLGITVIESITGATPFDQMPIEKIRDLKFQSASPEVKASSYGVSGKLARVLNKMIENTKESRYQNAHELIRDLKQEGFYSIFPSEDTSVIKFAQSKSVKNVPQDDTAVPTEANIPISKETDHKKSILSKPILMPEAPADEGPRGALSQEPSEMRATDGAKSANKIFLKVVKGFIIVITLVFLIIFSVSLMMSTLRSGGESPKQEIIKIERSHSENP